MLAEAQSAWSVNIIFRLTDCYFDSAMSYLKMETFMEYWDDLVENNDIDFIMKEGPMANE